MIKKLLLKPNLIPIIILFVCALIVCLPLLSSEINISYDDGVQHIARLIGTETGIKEGQTSIMSEFCNGFGYSWNLFYSPITAFVPLIFRIFGASYINCIKLFMFVITFISGITMYFFAKDVTKNKKIAVIAGVIYIFAPYRFTDMYIRNALAELTSFAFIPMVFQGIYGILKKKEKREIIFIVGTALLVLTHMIVTIYVAIICFIYVLTQINKLKEKKIVLRLFYSLTIILLLTCFFWAPLLQIKNSAQYEVFKPGRMERQDVLIALKLNLKDLFFTDKSNSMIYEIGLFNILMLICTPFIIKKMKSKYKKTDFYRFYIFSIIATIVLLIMTLKIFPFEKLPDLLRMIQFTFRLLEFTSLFISFVVAVNICKVIKNLNYRHITIIIGILVVLSIYFLSHLIYTNNLNEDYLIPAVPVTENTGRVHAGCASFEYLPSKAFENRNYIETRSNNVIVLNGEAQINDIKKEGAKLNCNVNCENDTELELPYIYYPGYEVKIDGNVLETFETDKGFVGIKLQKCSGTLNVSYTGTKIMNATKVISILSVLGLIPFLLTKKKK